VAFSLLYEQHMKNWSHASLKYVVVFASGAFVLAWGSQDVVAQSKQNPALAPPAVLSAADKAAIENFDKQVKSYVQLRNKVRENTPKLSKDSTPEQIHAYRIALEESVRNARTSAKRGEFFRPEIAEYIRRTLKTEFQGKDRRELRDTIFETELQGVVLRVNYPYAQSAELSEMPATLLAKLPQLPKDLRYRFVGRNMLLVDRESNLIIDYMPEALP
jgi:hypothetical protein